MNSVVKHPQKMILRISRDLRQLFIINIAFQVFLNIIQRLLNVFAIIDIYHLQVHYTLFASHRIDKNCENNQ